MLASVHYLAANIVCLLFVAGQLACDNFLFVRHFDQLTCYIPPFFI